ncbi:hypothetical protein [Acetivibrio saccincola]|jgi:hypothetical protein|uniref:Uncharacterized protein n=1 Tax=Acetivibrio saccincola TaxID=1677857 RepID=A0A2K9DYY1_9FIRM|nr:hypothetical protein [Acetivibrio saccincola]AUG56727.1 hypothetical protein HVS_03910 [Acetivibrio saccincola]
MINMNKKMKDILKKNALNMRNDNKIPQFCDYILSKTKIIKNCIIFDEKNDLEEKNINFEKILKFCGDWTGYEVACNEIRITDYISFKQEEFYMVSRILNYLKLGLSKMYCTRKFCIIISIDNNHVVLRFHTYRENEGLWIKEDLEGYENPIIYEVF